MIVKLRILSPIYVVFLVIAFSLYPFGVSSFATPEDKFVSIGEPITLSEPTHFQELTNCGGESLPVINQTYEQLVIELVNSERVSRGIPHLKYVGALTEAYRYHSADLGQDNYFEHDTYDRVNNELVYVCSTWSRIATFYPGGRAENIAAGYPTPASVVAGWMSSSGHRHNILDTNFWEIGVGFYQGLGDYYYYWTQDFGKRIGVYPLIINNEAVQTTDRNVTLYIYGSWNEMRLRNNNDLWSDWMPFSNQVSWQLPGYSGEHTVQAEMRNSTTMKTSNDTINLYMSIPTYPELGNLPDQVTFTYNLTDRLFAPSSVILTPQNIGNDQPLTWQITQQGSWFTVSSDFGTTPASFEIAPNIVIESNELVYTGTMTVTITSPSGVIGSPKRVNLELTVIDLTTLKIYLPLMVAP